MYKALIGLMLASAVQQVNLSWADITNCRSRQCVEKLEQASRKILKIDWKPISVFPSEARRF